MISLLAATALTVGPALPAETAYTPNLFRLPAGCASPVEHVVDRLGRPELLPIAGRKGGPLAELAVMRTVNGCPVRVVSTGTVVPVQAEPSRQAYRLRPADGPANRR